MKRSLLIVIFFLAVYTIGCSSNKKFVVIEKKFFDTSSFDKNNLDTNKFNEILLNEILKVSHCKADSGCILIQMVFDSYPVRKYSLYDRTAQNFFVWDDHDHSFKKTTDSSKINSLLFVKDRTDSLENYAMNQKGFGGFDMGWYIINLIKRNGDSIFMNSYYLLSL